MNCTSPAFISVEWNDTILPQLVKAPFIAHTVIYHLLFQQYLGQHYSYERYHGRRWNYREQTLRPINSCLCKHLHRQVKNKAYKLSLCLDHNTIWLNGKLNTVPSNVTATLWSGAVWVFDFIKSNSGGKIVPITTLTLTIGLIVLW